jgi:hypothetical protein
LGGELWDRIIISNHYFNFFLENCVQLRWEHSS